MAKTTEWLTEREMAAWRAYIATSGRLLGALDSDLMAAEDLTNVDYGVLVSLSEAPDEALRMSSLAAIAGVEASAMTYRVGRMEKRGLVERKVCPEDRRGVLAVLTPEGRAVLERVAPTHVAAVRSLFIDRLSGDELDSVAEIFGRLASPDA
jgi:DNA-binding MarR family transcriptional regulator